MWRKGITQLRLALAFYVEEQLTVQLALDILSHLKMRNKQANNSNDKTWETFVAHSPEAEAV